MNWMGYVGYIAFFVLIMYFLLIRPQKKREKESKNMMETLSVGAKIITIGGIVGEVIHVSDTEVTIATSVEKTQMVFVKEAIRQIVKPETDEAKQ